MKKPKYINVVGRKKSGKTTLVEALIRELMACGMRVSTAKHMAHEHELDSPGTDSWKHRRAGSVSTVVLSPSSWACHAKRPPDPESAAWMDAVFQGSDVVLFEGDSSRTENPMIECVPENESSLFNGDERLIAIVSNSDAVGEAAHFKFKEIQRLCRFIVDYLDLDRDRT